MEVDHGRRTFSFAVARAVSLILRVVSIVSFPPQMRTTQDWKY